MIRRTRRVCIVLLSLLLVTPLLPAQDSELLTIVVKPGMSLRDIAQEYLHDPDLWQLILEVNGLDSPTDVKAGMKLGVPATQVAQSNKALQSAQDAIHEASGLGAKVFAEQQLADAVRLREQALEGRRSGDWDACRRLAAESQRAAGAALERTRQARNSAGQAVLSSRAGSVEGRESGELAWKDVPQGSVLVEKEKVRTLSSSQAEILFVDESRLRLAANSQAVIQKMRVDRLSNRQEASVSLVEGDLQALLGGSGRTKKFDLEAGGVTTDTRSSDFWMSRRGTTTKVANYDEAELIVTSTAGEQVTLNKNQGALLEQGRSAVKRNLLAAPVGLWPEDDHVVFRGALTLRWLPLPDAIAYRLEVSSDPSFRNLVKGRGSGAKGESFAMWRTTHTAEISWLEPDEEVEDGVYYWRISGIDTLGFPGAKSEIRRLRVRKESGAPYLAVTSPLQGAISRAATTVLEGAALSTGTLLLDGQPVEMAADGSFQVERQLQEGLNTFHFEVSDAGGGSSSVERTVIHIPDRPAVIEYDSSMIELAPKTYVTREEWLLVRGRTTAGARVTVCSESGCYWAGAIASSDEEGEAARARIEVGDEAAVYTASSAGAELGEFRLNLLVREERENFELKVTAPSGFVTEDKFTVVRDQTPPEIVMSEVPARVTSSASVRLAAGIEGSTKVTLNDTPVTLSDGVLDEMVSLQPGYNRIALRALDAVGNESLWERSVTLDQEPPSLTGTRVEPETVSGGDTIELVVQASDASHLKRSATYAIRVGQFVQDGALLLDPRTTAYNGSLTLPNNVSGRAVLLYVILEDQLGNRKTYHLHR